ncbi:MAG: ABC transporter permease [Erysipelotrichaceae bacterium]|nr:ABC transporter permease [Erysipelotrichaceae bacterium]
MSNSKDIIQNDDFTLAYDTDAHLIDKNYNTSSYAKDVWYNFKKNKGAVFGATIIVLLIFMSIIGPHLTGHTYKSIIIEHASLVPRIPFIEKLGIFNGYYKGYDQYAAKGVSDIYYLFGTDTQGRDLFTRVWSGTRISLMIALTAVIIDIFIGMVYGLISGYFGGKVDIFMQRFAEILNGIPTLVVVTLLGLVLPQGIVSIIFALMITGWIPMSRIARAQVFKLKESEFILASKTLGASHFQIIFKDILPNIFGQIIIMSMFSIPSAIFTEAFLSFVGLGVPAPLASLGSLISEGYKSITIYPHMLFSALIVLSLLMLSFNLFADGLRDAFDPKMKQM